MKLQALSFENFRAFAQLVMEFRSDLTVLTGQNGSGKSSVLDAAALAMSAYLREFPGVQAEDLSFSDQRQGGKGPVRLVARAEAAGQTLTWTRSFEGNRNLFTGAQGLHDYAAGLQRNMQERAPTILPVFCYYGARNWMRSRNLAPLQKVWIKNRLVGYFNCLQAGESENLLLSWFENMTYSKLQKLQIVGPPPDPSDLVVPALYAATEAMGTCYQAACPTAKTASFSYDVVRSELEVTATDAEGETTRSPLRLLGKGLQTVLLLCADLAARMAILNPQLGAVVTEETPGVVLIEEIEQHLHPSVQKYVLDALLQCFPQVQFIVTTNSPVVLANLDAKYIRELRGGQVYRTSQQTYAKPTDSILREVLRADPHPDVVVQALGSFYLSLENRAFDEADRKLGWLKECLGEDDPSVYRAGRALKKIRFGL